MANQKPSFLHKLLNVYFRILCILTVDLIITIINAKIISFQSSHHKIIVTMIGMLVVLLLVAFLFSIIDRFTKFILKITVEMGNLLGFRKTMIFILLTTMMFGLFSSYHYVWFGTWPDFNSINVKDLNQVYPF
ncbi:MAG: hypothetical protein SH817_07725 [Leptospira sp.]|nr:hypothetical protein [Leptospira sp.]